MVMSRLNQRQYGGFLSSSAGLGGGGGPSASISGNVSGSVDTGDARWTGIVVLVALAIAVLGWHGLKG